MHFLDVDSNLRHMLCRLALHQRHGEVHEFGGLTIASAGVQFSMFNAAVISAPASGRELARRIAAAATHFQARGLDWSCWVCEHWLDNGLRSDAASVFGGHGMRRAATYPGMVAERLFPASRDLPRLEIRRVLDGATQQAFTEVGCTCFHLPVDWFREIFGHDELWNTGFTGYAGYADDEAVTTAAVLATESSIGVYNVATLPGFERRGYAEAMMRYAIDQAQRETGLKRVVLQSTAQGFALYRRMGFQTVTRFAIYVPR